MFLNVWVLFYICVIVSCVLIILWKNCEKLSSILVYVHFDPVYLNLCKLVLKLFDMCMLPQFGNRLLFVNMKSLEKKPL